MRTSRADHPFARRWARAAVLALSAWALAAAPRPEAGTTVFQVVPTQILAGQQGTVPIEIQAQGIENAAGFSIAFDTAQLTFVSVALGSTVAAASLNVNSLPASSGRVGMALALGSGQTVPPGTYPLVLVTFQRAAGASGTTPISFGDDPIIREVSDAQANVVAATFGGGSVTPVELQSFEAE